MRILVTWGSKRGGTEGLARMLGEALREEGLEVELAPPDETGEVSAFDAVVVGGSLYANRWNREASRFVARHEKALRRKPVWFFSSGPLDDSADRQVIPPTRQVEVLMERVGAQGHMTFGGRLSPDARGFPAGALAKTHAGDWRRPERVRAWAAEISRALPTARPGIVMPQPGRSLGRLLLHGVVGWALCAAATGALLWAMSAGAALVIHALLAPVIFAAVARHYFRARGARSPLPVALTFVGVVALLDLVVVAGVVQHSLAMFGSVVGSWLPFLLIFLVTIATGEIMSTLPWTSTPKMGPSRA